MEYRTCTIVSFKANTDCILPDKMKLEHSDWEQLLDNGILIWQIRQECRLFSTAALRNWYADYKCAKLIAGSYRPGSKAARLGELSWFDGDPLPCSAARILTDKSSDNLSKSDTPTDTPNEDKAV